MLYFDNGKSDFPDFEGFQQYPTLAAINECPILSVHSRPSWAILSRSAMSATAAKVGIRHRDHISLISIS